MDLCSSQEEKMDAKKAYDKLKQAQGEAIDYKAAYVELKKTYVELKQAYEMLQKCFEEQVQRIAIYEEQIKQLRQDKFG